LKQDFRTSFILREAVADEGAEHVAGLLGGGEGEAGCHYGPGDADVILASLCSYFLPWTPQV